jgi:hypothetical protein
MYSRIARKMSYVALSALMVSGSVAFAKTSGVSPPAIGSRLTEPATEASQLLKEIQLISHDLNRDAATLESYTWNKMNWRSHASQLTQAKEHINAIGDRLERLQAIRHSVTPWQQQAIDSIQRPAMEVAVRTESAIRHLNESRDQLLASSYADHLTTIADQSNKLKQSVNVHLDLARTEEKANELREQIVEMQT